MGQSAHSLLLIAVLVACPLNCIGSLEQHSAQSLFPRAVRAAIVRTSPLATCRRLVDLPIRNRLARIVATASAMARCWRITAALGCVRPASSTWRLALTQSIIRPDDSRVLLHPIGSGQWVAVAPCEFCTVRCCSDRRCADRPHKCRNPHRVARKTCVPGRIRPPTNGGPPRPQTITGRTIGPCFRTIGVPAAQFTSRATHNMLRRRFLPWEYGVRNLLRRPAHTLLTWAALTIVVLLVLVVVGFIRGLEASLAISGDASVMLVYAVGAGENIENSAIAGARRHCCRPVSKVCKSDSASHTSLPKFTWQHASRWVGGPRAWGWSEELPRRLLLSAGVCGWSKATGQHRAK